jgi:hypothetical protein
MGLNDEGKESPTKKISQQLLLDFLDVPKAEASAEARARRNRDGVYSFTRFPLNDAKITEQNKNQMNVCFLMIDGRTNRDAPNGYGTGDMLGEEQWKWLEQVLKTGRDPDFEKPDPSIKSIDDACVVTFLGSGTFVTSDAGIFEGFGEFPSSRDRLLRLLRKSGARKLVILSGDVHHSQISVLRANKLNRQTLADGSLEPEQPYHVCGESPFEDYDLYEVTSSGTTHHLHPLLDNKERFEWMFPNHRLLSPGVYTKENGGLIQIDCPVPSDPRSCNIGIAVVALPEARREVQRITLNFALDSAEVVHQKSNLGAAEIAICQVVNDPENYHLPTYYAPWTESLMWLKRNVPAFADEGRLVVLFAELWAVVILSVLFVIVTLSCLCCRCRRRGGRGKREEGNKKKND